MTLSDAEKIMAVLNEIDPEGLIAAGAPRDEYKSEALILLEHVCAKALSPQYVRDVWLVQFASGKSIGRRPRTWVGEMPMHPVFATIAERVNTLFPQRKP